MLHARASHHSGHATGHVTVATRALPATSALPGHPPPRGPPHATRVRSAVCAAGGNGGAGPELVGADGSRTTSAGSKWAQREANVKEGSSGDYLEELGRQDAAMRTTVGARSGMVDSVYAGDFLGMNSDLGGGELRGREFSTLEHLDPSFEPLPRFLDRFVMHIAKNVVAHALPSAPLILGIWGPKGSGKSYQIELACRKMGITPIIMSAGELEDEWAGNPGKRIRDRYRAAALKIKSGRMSVLVINDVDAGVGNFKDTQATVNRQLVAATLMALADSPHRDTEWRREDELPRVPIILTANDLTPLYAPLLRDGRMDKFFWEPTGSEIVDVIMTLFGGEGDPNAPSRADLERLHAEFPRQPLDFWGAIRSRASDVHAAAWIEDRGGPEGLAAALGLMAGTPPPRLETGPPTLAELQQAGRALAQEQQHVLDNSLAEDYMFSGGKERGTNIKRGRIEAEEKATLVREKTAEEIAAAEAAAAEAAAVIAKAREDMLRKQEEANRAAEAAAAAAAAEAEAAAKAAAEAAVVQETVRGWRTATIDEVRDMVFEEGVTYIDVRPMREYRRDAIKGSVCVPAVEPQGMSLDAPEDEVEGFPEAVAAAAPDRSTPIAIGCHDGGARSSRAAERLVEAGFAAVTVMEGGFDAYSVLYTPAGVKRVQGGAWKDQGPTIWTDS